jgi:hypothetical protein
MKSSSTWSNLLIADTFALLRILDWCWDFTHSVAAALASRKQG